MLAAPKGKAYAAVLSSFSDTVTTSRPSASTPLTANVGASDGQAQVVSEDAGAPNYSIFLASDSARFIADTGETEDTVNVASMSAADKPAAGSRIVYFTSAIGHTHHLGDTVVVPITAMHTIQFTTQTTIPNGGKIIITFPGSGDNSASPSATTFAFNGLTSGNASSNIQTNNATTCTWTVAAPSITCATNASIAGGTTITFLIGCAAASGASCTTQAPRLINPTKSVTNNASGLAVNQTTADNWRINVQTQDTPGNGSTVLDQSTTTIGLIESVQIQASVDPTLTFSINGMTAAQNINSVGATGCPNEAMNSGIASNATFVNLGLLTSGKINLAGQYISISTNEAGGYSLTATSSGSLKEPSSGYAINSPNAFNTMSAGTEEFGLHACGSDANASFVPGSSITGGSGKVYWPTPTASVLIASHASVTAAIITGIEYAATVSGTTPAGIYNTVITYVATPTFN